MRLPRHHVYQAIVDNGFEESIKRCLEMIVGSNGELSDQIMEP